MKLSEVMVPMNPKLSDMQSNVLFRVFMSGGSPQAGAQAMKGNDYLMSAAEQLVQQGMIAQNGGGIVITQKGVAALKNQGLIDQNNQPTDLAQKYSDDANSDPVQNNNPGTPNSAASSDTVNGQEAPIKPQPNRQQQQQQQNVQ
jgi:hypothetical protein